MNQALFIYFSQSGNIKRVVDKVSTLVNGDILEIEAKIPYTGSNKEVIEQWKPEFYENKLRDSKQYSIDFELYDTVFICAPNWGGMIPPPLQSFLMNNTFKDQTVIPIISHGGGGLSTCAEQIYKITNCLDKVTPLVVKKDFVDQLTILNWLSEIGYNTVKTFN